MPALASHPHAPGSWEHSLRVCGSLIWNDCKQGLRKHLAGATTRDKLLRSGGALFGLAFLGGLHFAAFALVSYTALSPSSDLHALMVGLSTSIWSFLLFVMMSGGLVRALVVLHEQDDSSLLLSSPVQPRAILAGRLFGNALQSCLVDGFIIVPYINIRIFVADSIQFHFLWGYVVWFALAIIVTCIDGLFSFGLIRWFGLRRARFFSQAIPFLLIFGVTFFAGSVSVSIAQLSSNQAHMPPDMQAHFIALSQTPLAWMAYAAAGYPVYLLGVIVIAIALALITLQLTERAFVEGSQFMTESVSSARAGLRPEIVITAMDADIIKTYVDLGLGVGILASIAMDEDQPGRLRAVDARHLFSINTTSVAVRRGGLLRGYAYDFIQTFASHLTREVVEAAQAAPSDTEQAPL